MACVRTIRLIHPIHVEYIDVYVSNISSNTSGRPVHRRASHRRRHSIPKPKAST